MSKPPFTASGFKEDCMKLLSLFDETNSIRFDNFCTLWKDMKFAMIYAGRQTYSELLEYCEEVMHIAKEFSLPPRSFKERIGGLYLLYGLYYKMPIKDVVRIRVTQEQWANFLELQQELRAGEHLDANFILSTLIHDEAFINTIFDHEWGLEKFYREKQAPSNAYSVMPSVLELTQEGRPLAEIINLAKSYRQATSSIEGSNFNLFNEDFVQDILADIRKLETSKPLEQSNSVEIEYTRSERPRPTTTTTTSTTTPQRRDSNKVRIRIGDGFDMETSEEEEEDEAFEPLENYDPNLAETFEDDIEVEPESKRPKFVEITLPSASFKLEQYDGNSLE